MSEELFDKFNRLTLIDKGTDKGKRRKYLWLCDCGQKKWIRREAVANGRTKSCGCLQIEYVTNSTHAVTHGDSKTRLYNCWTNMKGRAARRKDCEVCTAWQSWALFKKWALSSGYEDTLLLCRNGDVGDYSPDNARWDTKSNNGLEANGNLRLSTG